MKLDSGAGDLLPPGPDPGTRVAGDVRSGEMPGLSSMHTLWVREHNRVAAAIRGSVDDDAGKSDAEIDEEVYQRARQESCTRTL